MEKASPNVSLGEQFCSVPVVTSGQKSAIRFHFNTGLGRDLLGNWRRAKAGGGREEKAVIYAKAAFLRFRSYLDLGQKAVSSLAAATEAIEENAIREIQLSIVGVTTSPAGLYATVALLRRTWAGNLTIDYLAAHPKIVAKTIDVDGIGTSILLGIFTMASALKCPAVWVETAADSSEFYQKNLGLADGSDLIMVETKQAVPHLNRTITRRLQKCAT